MALIDEVRQVCQRLVPGGWAALLLAHGLDIEAPDLAAELARPLPDVDRSIPGFEDFALAGRRGVEPRDPALSLLYHALASPDVVTGADGAELTDFPTLAELDAVEDYVYAAQGPPSLGELLAENRGAHMAVAVFATEYRPSLNTPHRRHADVCFARTGVARVGTTVPRYDGRRRGFRPEVADDPHQLRVLPARYSAYLAVQLPGDSSAFLPLRHRSARDTADGRGDESRQFWVPVHKLFRGQECLRGLDLHVDLVVRHVNEKLRRIHLALGPDASWREPDISAPPFRFEQGIAELATERDWGPGVLVPVPHARLVEPAEYQGRPLTFRVPPNAPLSSSLNLPSEGLWRHAPEYVHVRHVVTDEGEELDLNQRADVAAVVASGGYRARHYLDFTGDGWVRARVPELAVAVPRRRSAYSLVAAPDFFPGTDQRELTEWVSERLPSTLRRAIWRVPPDPLSDQRIPANLQLAGGGFRADDDTVTAVVARRRQSLGRPTRIDARPTDRHSHLPDDAAGVFAPGWDVSVDGAPGRPQHLATYGLGSPFPEDAKLCAALSSFWPAVAPDAARTFEPSPDWPTVVPLTDEEVGIVGDLPWDGVQGPRLLTGGGREVVEYASLAHADYVENALAGRFTLALTARVDDLEYQSRILAMIRVYEALGVTLTSGFGEVVRQKARWSVLSFRPASPEDADARQAQDEAGAVLQADGLYRFHVFLHGARRTAPLGKVHIEVLRSVRLLVDPVTLLLQEGSGPWRET